MNVGDDPIKLEEIWLLHLMLKLWLTVILYEICVRGDGFGGSGRGRRVYGSNV